MKLRRLKARHTRRARVRAVLRAYDHNLAQLRADSRLTLVPEGQSWDKVYGALLPTVERVYRTLRREFIASVRASV